jgi:hypothetical protein
MLRNFRRRQDYGGQGNAEMLKSDGTGAEDGGRPGAVWTKWTWWTGSDGRELGDGEAEIRWGVNS